jgi:hypothetical protein
MNPRLFAILVPLLLGTIIVGLSPNAGRACAPAKPHNKAVEIASESAIIIWDEASKVQHFIRRATFNTDAEDFGFLVPTPTEPELASADDSVFNELAELTKPEVITKPSPSGGVRCGCSSSKGRDKDRDLRDKVMGAEPQVKVLQEKEVAGRKAVVLEARDPDALINWLKENHYEVSDALKEWVSPYVKMGWKITAFKIASAAAAAEVATKSERMTFKAERPFFPYREPESKGEHKGGSRLLRVFFLAKQKVKGVLGDKGAAWPGQVAWANKLEPADREKILKLLDLPAATPPASWWLTEFEDRSSPRPGREDVFFSPDADQTTVKRPPHVHYTSSSLPDCVMCYALAAYLVIPCLVRHCRRRK